MKKLLQILTLVLLTAVSAKAQVALQSYVFTATGPQPAVSLISNPVDKHIIMWRPVGTVTTCTVAVDISPDGVAWTAGGAIAGQTCTSAGEFTSAVVVANYVRVNLTTLTGGGSLVVVYSGVNSVGGSVVSGAVTVTGGAPTGSAPSGNPVLVAGQDGTPNVRVFCVSAGGQICTAGNITTPDGVANSLGGEVLVSPTATVQQEVRNILFNGTTWDRMVKCPTAVAIVVAAAGTQQVVAPVAGQKVRVCGLYLTVSTAGTLSITEGTGATCGTGTTTIFGQTVNLPTGGYPIISSPTSVMQTNVNGDGLCIVSGTAAVQGWAQVEQH